MTLYNGSTNLFGNGVFYLDYHIRCPRPFRSRVLDSLIFLSEKKRGHMDSGCPSPSIKLKSKTRKPEASPCTQNTTSQPHRADKIAAPFRPEQHPHTVRNTRVTPILSNSDQFAAIRTQNTIRVRLARSPPNGAGHPPLPARSPRVIPTNAMINSGFNFV